MDITTKKNLFWRKPLQINKTFNTQIKNKWTRKTLGNLSDYQIIIVRAVLRGTMILW